MSCFIVTDEHISVLADYLVRPRADEPSIFHSGTFGRYDPKTGEDWTAQQIGEILHAANVASWNARYPRDPTAPAFQLRRTARRSPVEIIKAVHCYDYQSCEYEGWERSDARRISSAILEHAIRSLPGYDAAPWGMIDLPSPSSGRVAP